MRKSTLLVLAVAALVACSKSSVKKPSADDAVTIVATDSGFTLPDTLHSGLNHFVYENHGKEIHECQFIHLPEGMTPAQYVAQAKSGIAFPEGAKDCSGAGLSSPGERVEVWVPLEEGRYMIGCWMGNHMQTQRPVSFIVHGTAAKPVEPPHEDVTVRLIDFRFELTGPLKRGEQTLRYETVGPSMHEADIFRLDDGRTTQDVRAWFKSQERNPVPGMVSGGCLDSHDIKRVIWVRRTFTPGRYVFWCDMPMIQTATPTDTTVAHVTHADAGMVKEFTID